MKINSTDLLLNLLGAEVNFYLNRILLYKLGLEEAFFMTYLLDQFKLLRNEGKLRKDNSFYASNSSISLYTTISEFRISELKKSAISKEIIRIKQEGIPTKTYYYINFDKLLEIVSTDKGIMEIAYEYAKIYNYKNNIETSMESLEDIENLKKQSVKSLRFICKENNISYTGNDRKDTLINKIIETINPKLFLELEKANTDFIAVDEISSTSGQKNCPLVVRKTVTNQVLIKPNTNTCHDRVPGIENLLKSFDVNYTNTNVESINLIFEKLDNDKELLKEYLIEFYQELLRNSYDIKNKSAFFSSKLKTPNEFLIKKLLAKKNVELEKIKKEEEKIVALKTEEDNKEKILKSYEMMDKFNNLSSEKQEEILKEAEEKYILKSTEDEINTMKNIKNFSTELYRKFLIKEIKNIMSVQKLL